MTPPLEPTTERGCAVPPVKILVCNMELDSVWHIFLVYTGILG